MVIETHAKPSCGSMYCVGSRSAATILRLCLSGADGPFSFCFRSGSLASGQRSGYLYNFVVVELSLLFCFVLLRVDIVKPELPAARMTFISSSFHFSFSFDSL